MITSVSANLNTQGSNCFFMSPSMVWVTQDTFERLTLECLFWLLLVCFLNVAFRFGSSSNAENIVGNLLAKSKLFSKVAFLNSLKNIEK